MIPAPSEGAQVQLPRHPIYISHTPSFGLDRSPALSGTPDRTQQHEATSTPPLTRHFAPPPSGFTCAHAPIQPGAGIWTGWRGRGLAKRGREPGC